MNGQTQTAKLEKQSNKSVSKTEKSVKHLADNIFKNLCDEGFQPKDIIGVSSQLLSLVTSELKKSEASR